MSAGLQPHIVENLRYYRTISISSRLNLVVMQELNEHHLMKDRLQLVDSVP